MPKPSLKEAILEAGLKAMFRTGYNGTSVRDVTAAAGAPQGSFTNHFRSKEAFASCIAEAQKAREISSEFEPQELAEFLLASWQGAILRMKVERNAAPLERFKEIAFQTVFKELSS